DGIPTPDDDVIIDAIGLPYSINLDIDATINSLTINTNIATLRIEANGNAGRTLTVASGVTSTGGLVLDNIGATGAGVASLNVTGGSITNNGTLTADAGVGGRTI